MTTPFEDMQRQIVDRRRQIEQQRQLAQEAERQRREAEEAPQRAIAAAEQELRQLERQAAEVRWSEIAANHSAALAKQRTLAGEMFTILEKADFVTARELMKSIITEGQRAGQLRELALATVKSARQEAHAAAWDRRLSAGNGQLEQFELARSADADPLVRSFDRFTLPEAPTPYEIVRNWVTAEPEGLSRQFRRGLVFAAFGSLGDLDIVFSRLTNLPLYGV